jgi:hypothetical protein
MTPRTKKDRGPGWRQEWKRLPERCDSWALLTWIKLPRRPELAFSDLFDTEPTKHDRLLNVGHCATVAERAWLRIAPRTTKP